MDTPQIGDTLATIALKKYAEKLETKAIFERATRRQHAQNAAADLAQWSGLPFDVLPDDYPFNWQGYWFRPGDEGRPGTVEIYAWDSDRGWDFWRVRSIFEIGERIAEWVNVEPEDRPRLARDASATRLGDYLPDSVRALLAIAQEA